MAIKKITLFFLSLLLMISCTVEQRAPRTSSLNTKSGPGRAVTETIYTSTGRLKDLGLYKNDFEKEAFNERDAIKRFQARVNLQATGVLDEATAQKLQSTYYLLNRDHFDNVMPESFIVINKTLRTIKYYKNSGLRVEYAGPVAIGRSYGTNSLSRSGVYKVQEKVVNRPWYGMNGKYKPEAGGSRYNPLGYRWIGMGDGRGIHGNSHGKSGYAGAHTPGLAETSGCHRMINSDIENDLYEKVAIGTPIYVGYEKELEARGIHQPK